MGDQPGGRDSGDSALSAYRQGVKTAEQADAKRNTGDNTEALADLRSAMASFVEASAESGDAEIRTASQLNAGRASAGAYLLSGEPRDQAAAMRYTRLAIASAPNDELRLQAAMAFGSIVVSPASISRDDAPSNVNDGIMAFITDSRGARSDYAKDNPDAARVLATLYRARFSLTGDLDDLDASLDTIEPFEDQSDDFAAALVNTLLDRHRWGAKPRSPDLDDLDRAVEMSRSLVGSAPSNPSDQSLLSTALLFRYRRDGRIEDIEGAIAAAEAALEGTTVGDPNRQLRQYHLAVMLLNDESAKRSRTRDDLDRIIDLLDQASTGAFSVDSQEALANAYAERFASSGNRVDIDRAIDAGETALDQEQSGSPSHAPAAGNLATIYSDRYKKTRDMDDRDSGDLDRAIELFENVVLAVGSPEEGDPTYTGELGAVRFDRYLLSGAQTDLDAARAGFNRACESGETLARRATLNTALKWAWREVALAEDQPPPNHLAGFEYAKTALEFAGRILTEGYQGHVGAEQRRVSLRSGWEWTGDSAWVLARLGRVQDAVVALEEGMTRYLSEALASMRGDLERMRKIAPITADRYELASRRMAELNEHSDGSHLDAARLELADALAEIRELNGFESFLRSPGWDEVAGSVHAEEPLLYLLTTPWGSLALLVSRADETVDVSSAFLTGFTSETLALLLRGEEEGPGWFPMYGEFRLDPNANRDRFERTVLETLAAI